MRSYTRLKWACYTGNITMSVIGNLTPLLFLTLRSLYGISYSLLGLLVLINFTTQLAIDLVFSFFSHKFNIATTVKSMPLIGAAGLLLLGAAPFLFPQHVYVGLVLGTVVASAASGLAEVLISPVIAAIPAENPEREMSKLHAVYAWGVVAIIPLCTLFLHFGGGENWMWLPMLTALFPLFSAFLYAGAEIPVIETPGRVSRVLEFMKNKTLWLCVIGIFLGGASEVTMAQWSSSYLEQVGIPKLWGDIFGVALFGATLGLGRTLYGKIGKNVERALFWGAIGASVCYLVAAVTSVPLIGLVACAVTGFCVSMMWPGSLVVASDRFPDGGVFVFAMMAAGGDLGASVGPQLVGSVADTVLGIPALTALAERWALTPDQFGMKCGLLIGALFPLAGIGVYAAVRQMRKSL